MGVGALVAPALFWFVISCSGWPGWELGIASKTRSSWLSVNISSSSYLIVHKIVWCWWLIMDGIGNILYRFRRIWSTRAGTGLDFCWKCVRRLHFAFFTRASIWFYWCLWPMVGSGHDASRWEACAIQNADACGSKWVVCVVFRATAGFANSLHHQRQCTFSSSSTPRSFGLCHKYSQNGFNFARYFLKFLTGRRTPGISCICPPWLSCPSAWWFFVPISLELKN